jgi:RNA polymerase sigma factor (sigma-70 family)
MEPVMKSPDDSMTPALAQALDQLLKAQGAGREEAINEVFRLCETRLRALVHRMLVGFPNVRRWEETDDVFQNAAIRLHRTLRQIPVESPRDLFALAAKQLHWELIDLARLHGAGHGGKLATNALPADGPLDRAAAPEPSGMEQWAAFHTAVEALPPEFKEIFHLVWYMGADQKTVCELTGKPLRTVRRHWAKARDAVKASLGGEPPALTQN